jgi:ammonia channel protein AmtB
VRSKNALNTMMMSFVSMGFVGVLWAVVGYSLAFAPVTTGSAIPRVFLHGVCLEPQGTIPHLLFMCYQGTFAITAALISGAIVGGCAFGVCRVHLALALVVSRLCTGVGWRLARRYGRARLRRRHGGPSTPALPRSSPRSSASAATIHPRCCCR